MKVDNGPEFSGRMLDQWAHLKGVEIDFSRPGKPTDNAHIEAFNSRLRAACLIASTSGMTAHFRSTRQLVQ